ASIHPRRLYGLKRQDRFRRNRHVLLSGDRGTRRPGPAADQRPDRRTADSPGDRADNSTNAGATSDQRLIATLMRLADRSATGGVDGIHLAVVLERIECQ